LISYAQNFEDVILMRALKDVVEGAYVDVGAHDPIVNSVSLAFYQRGWRGVHVDPSPEAAAALRASRPDEITIQAAVSTQSGAIVLTAFEGTGLTTGIPDFARLHEEARWVSSKLVAETVTLAAVLERLEGQEIHWLKIDVEGMENDVLQSWGDSEIRPWIVVAESTIPMSQQENFSEWEPHLLQRGYIFVYFDGLNRYYVHDSHQELTSSFGPGANYFDDFSITKDSLFARLLNKEHEDDRASLLALLSSEKLLNENCRTEASELISSEKRLNEEYLTEISRLTFELGSSGQLNETLEYRIKEFERSLINAKDDNDRLSDVVASVQTSLRKSELKLAEFVETNVALNGRMTALHESLDISQRQLLEVTAKNVELENFIARVISSAIWRLTAPVRALIGPDSDPSDWRVKMWQRLLFRRSGRPIKIVRRALFHTSGKPRRRTSGLVLSGDGSPRSAFRRWMESAPYRQLTRPHTADKAELELSESGQNGGRSKRRKGRPRAAILAVVAPDGTTGGAERLYRGLAGAVNNLGFDADLIAVPFDESTFESIQAGYAFFESMNLDEYDIVISTKSPSYCVTHRNHVVYLVHTIRVFYDMFDSTFPDPAPYQVEQRDWIIRSDTEALSRIRRRFAIGEEVVRRLRAYNELDAVVLHPGLDLAEVAPASVGDYFFFPGRLHRWKRVDLAIEAVRRSPLPFTLRIAGAGEQEEELRRLAGDDPRIIFDGYVDDARLKELYAGALAVIFCPVREDYGYVTIEAFAFGKPVITCLDSGEPLQFVSNKETGFVCEPNPESLEVAMSRLWLDREGAQRMGERAAEIAKEITWARVAEKLGRPKGALGSLGIIGKRSDRLKVCVVDMQPITPPVGGGRLRLLGLYHNLGADFDTRYVGAYDWPGERKRESQISPSLKELVLPLSDAHYAEADVAKARAGGKVVIDMLFAEHAHLSPEYISALKVGVEWADIVIFSHPWAAPLVTDAELSGKLVVYDSQNMEIDLRKRILDCQDTYQASIIEAVEAAERLVGTRADLILACSAEDRDRFALHYGWPLGSIEVVPNGVFASDFPEMDISLRAGSRRRVGLEEHMVTAFFVGSNYGPNAEAAAAILEHIAPACPDILFVVAGGVCASLPEHMPANVRAVGYVSDEELEAWLFASDIAINPMRSGSGTNIKMFDYAAAGLPIITTPVGARGIVQTSSHGITVCDITLMPAALKALMSNPIRQRFDGKENRRLVEDRFSWEKISPELGMLLTTEILKKRGASAKSLITENRKTFAHFSTVGHKCGIGEYTRHIISSMDKCDFGSLIFTCDTPNARPSLAGLEDRAFVSWFNDNVGYSDSRLHDQFFDIVSRLTFSYAIIQHHPAFLPAGELRRLVRAFQEVDACVIIVTHAYAREQAPVVSDMLSLGVPVFTHKKRDVFEAEADGVRLLHLPFALPMHSVVSRRATALDPLAPVIVSNGFLRAHKGLDRLVDAFGLVREQIPNARLRLLCSLYPSEDSEATRDELIRRVALLGIEESVDFDFRYLEKQTLLHELAGADLAVFPYSESAEGGSAAAADAISVGLPVIVSRSSIFEDIRDVAVTSSTDPKELAEGIIAILNSEAMYERLALRTFAYAERNSWDRIIDIMAGTFASIETAYGIHRSDGVDYHLVD